MIQRYLEKYPQEMPHEYIFLIFLFSILKAIICIKYIFFLWCLQSAIVFKFECGFETFNSSSGSQLACHGVNFVNVTCNYIHKILV